MSTKFITAKGKEIDLRNSEAGDDFAVNLAFQNEEAYQLRKKNGELFRRKYVQAANRWIQERYQQDGRWQYVGNSAPWNFSENEQPTFLDEEELEKEGAVWLEKAKLLSTEKVNQTSTPAPAPENIIHLPNLVHGVLTEAPVLPRPALKPAPTLELDEDLDEVAQVMGKDRVLHYLQKGLTKPFIKMLCSNDFGVLAAPVDAVLRYSTDKAHVVAALGHAVSTPRVDFKAAKFVSDTDSRYSVVGRKQAFPDEDFAPQKSEPAIRAEYNNNVTAALNTLVQLTSDHEKIGKLATRSPDRKYQPPDIARSFAKEYVLKRAQKTQAENNIQAADVEARKANLPVPTPIPARAERLIDAPRPRLSRTEREQVELQADIQANIAFAMAAVILCQRAGQNNQQHIHAYGCIAMVADFDIDGLKSRVVALSSVAGLSISHRELEEKSTLQQENNFLESSSGLINKCVHAMARFGMFGNHSAARPQAPAQPCTQEAAASAPTARDLQRFMIH